MKIRTSYEDLPAFDENPFVKSESEGRLARIAEQARLTFKSSTPKAKVQRTVYVAGRTRNSKEIFYSSNEVLVKSTGEVCAVEDFAGGIPIRVEEIERYEIIATAEEIFNSSFGIVR